jgi:tetratricopeptide (TPR) repeat protein
MIMAELSNPMQNQSTKPKQTRQQAETEQNAFELKFFSEVLERYPDYVDALRVFGNLLTRLGHYEDSLEIDRRVVRLRPEDATAHYNLACSYCLLRKHEQTLTSLRKAFELGYDDFSFLRKDRDLESIRQDRRFKVLLREFTGR